MENEQTIIWLDTETTGFSSTKNDVIQLAMLIEDKGIPVAEVMYRMQPHSYEHVKDEALQMNGITLDILKQCPHASHFFPLINDTFNRYPPGYAVLAGFNLPYDIRMLEGYFAKCDRVFQASNYDQIDVMQVAREHHAKKEKLEILCEMHDIEHHAHDAMGDVKATRELYYKLTAGE